MGTERRQLHRAHDEISKLKREAAFVKNGLKQLKKGAYSQLTKTQRGRTVKDIEYIPRNEFLRFRERLRESVEACVNLVFDGVERDRQLAKFTLEQLSSDG